MAKPLSINVLETLVNLLDMYESKYEEILVLEAIANGMDANADEIEINFDEDDFGYYVIFSNNGPPMNEKDFDNYHNISSSTKTKGEGIGFAGVGAKIFLGAWDKAEITTITGKNNKVFVSRMFRENNKVLHESSLDGVPIKQILRNRKLNHSYGTSYKVKIDAEGFKWLKNNIYAISQFWFNYALISKSLKIKINNKDIKPWQPKGEKISKKISYKNQKISCHIWISNEDIPEDQRHVVYSVFGKRIKNESVDWSTQLKGDNNTHVFCMVDVSILASHLTSNKENFKKNYQTNSVCSVIKKAFYNELDKKGLISKPGNNSTYSNIVVNELTKRLDRILQSPDLKFLNPNSNLKNQDILIKSDEGNSQSDEIIINQASQKNNTSNEFNSTDSLNNTENKVNLSKDKKGKHKGQNKTQKTRGIAIIVEDFPDDPREGWVDVINNAVVYNVGHPLSKTVAESHSLHNYNLTRVIISSLIKAKNDQVDMDAVIAFGYFEKIFCDAWLQ